VVAKAAGDEVGSGEAVAEAIRVTHSEPTVVVRTTTIATETDARDDPITVVETGMTMTISATE